jgi:hypothetical protein
MALPAEYKDFDAFLEKALILIKEKGQGPTIDYWLGASSIAFGAPMLAQLLGRLGLRGALGGAAAGLLPFMPVASLFLGAGITAAMATYFSKGTSAQGAEIKENLRAAKTLFEEYTASSLRDEKKVELLDQLLARLVAGERIAQ